MRIIKINENNAHYWHMRLWNWLAKHPTKEKRDWPGWRYVEFALFHCFACTIGADRAKKNGKKIILADRCKYCPIADWKSDMSAPCETLYEFSDWKNFKSPKTKKKYAKIIAEKEWEYYEKDISSK